MKRKWTNTQFRSAVRNSTSKSEVLRKLGLGVLGGNFRTFDKYVIKMGLDISHFDPYHSLRGKPARKKRPLSEILVEDSSYSTFHLKQRLLAEGILSPCCSYCTISDWQGKELALHLDHINGKCYDHRIENLRLLCPNCHSQTETYCGRALRKPQPFCKDCGISISRRAVRCLKCVRKAHVRKKKELPPCLSCGIKVSKRRLRCRPCAAKARVGVNTKIDWPSLSDLQQMVHNSSFVAVGKKLGVSDNAIRKHLKKRSGGSGRS